MGIAFLIMFFVDCFLPVLALLAWIVRYMIVVRENEESGRNTTFTGFVKDTLGKCYGFYIVLFVYFICENKLLEITHSNVVELFEVVPMMEFCPPGYFFIGCLIIGLSYSYLFYKHHCK